MELPGESHPLDAAARPASHDREGGRMSDYITLLGSEQVQSAGISMRGAADRMNDAANSISYSMERFERLIERFEQAVERLQATEGVK
jgi:hypothetical protein